MAAKTVASQSRHGYAAHMAHAGYKWLVPKQVAGLCGISAELLTKRRRLRLPPAFYLIGNKVLYRADEIEVWLESTRHEPL